MDNIRHLNDFPPLTIGRIHNLAVTIRYSFGGKLARADFIEHLLMLLEDVPGFESGEVAATLVELAWAEYGNRRGRT